MLAEHLLHLLGQPQREQLLILRLVFLQHVYQAQPLLVLQPNLLVVLLFRLPEQQLLVQLLMEQLLAQQPEHSQISPVQQLPEQL